MSPKDSRIETIDLLRALAIFMVVVHHARGMLYGFMPRFLGEAWTGVDLFFVISGYLVAGSFSRWLEKAGPRASLKTRATLALHYSLRRLLRILPPAWIWAGVYTLAAHFFNTSGEFGSPAGIVDEFLAVLSFAYNYYVVSMGQGGLVYFWSLAVEEQFYIVLPAFFLFVRKLPARLVGFALILILCETARVIANQAGHTYFELRLLTHFRADGLALGACLGLLADPLKKWGESAIFKGYLRFFMLFLMIVSLALLWALPGLLTKDELADFGYASFALLSGFLVAIAAAGKHLLPLPLKVRSIFAAMGRRSYSIYLIHLPAHHGVGEAMVQILGPLRFEAWKILLPWVWPVSSLLAIGLLTELNYRFIELPLIALGKKKFRGEAI